MDEPSAHPLLELIADAAQAAPGATAYRGRERRAAPAGVAGLLAQTFDEIDYGLLLLADNGAVMHINHAARTEIDAGYPLQFQGGRLHARHPGDVSDLEGALAGARRGLRKLLSLGEADQRVGISIVPLGGRGDAGQVTLLLMGKRTVCEKLSVQWFARAHGLTATETRILEALCEGDDPREVAARHAVGMSTVRSQIRSIRRKAGTDSIRELVRRVAVLPPMRSALRMR